MKLLWGFIFVVLRDLIEWNDCGITMLRVGKYKNRIFLKKKVVNDMKDIWNIIYVLFEYS